MAELIQGTTKAIRTRYYYKFNVSTGGNLQVIGRSQTNILADDIIAASGLDHTATNCLKDRGRVVK